MIDLHSHLLPGIDDGARSIDDSLALIKQSVESGVTKIIATPHIHIGTFDNDLQGITFVFEQLIDLIKSSNISIDLAFAAEVRICPEILLMAKSNQLPFLGKYKDFDVLLLEFPHSHILPGSDKLVDWLIKQNICPMIAHPERNRSLWKSPELINDFVEKGCLLQITAASLVGNFGEQSQNLAFKLLDEKCVFVVASDMHSIKRRPNLMADAYRIISDRYDSKTAELLCVTNPGVIFNSNPTRCSF